MSNKTETLWHGRFATSPTARAIAFETSIHEDARLAFSDITGSIAHAKMLCKVGILSDDEESAIERGLLAIKSDLQAGSLAIDESAEDIHSFIEQTLVARIGDAGKKLHTARSRNDQIALDERLYLRDTVVFLHNKIAALVRTLAKVAHSHTTTIMPGYTHTQHAQCVTLAHHLCAYGFMFQRDAGRLQDCLSRINICPIGSGALATTSLPIDREYEAALLAFPKVTQNSMDAVSDRDYCIELCSCLAIIQTHLSRFCQDIILWQTSEYAFINLSEEFSTGSSIMPQKKNPDYAELIRGRAGHVYGYLVSLLTMMKALPLSYNRDMQEDKVALFSAIDTVASSLDIFIDMIKTATFNDKRMRDSCEAGFLVATDVAEYLVRKGLPFRTAHEVSAHLVTLAEGRGTTLSALSIEDFRQASSLFDSDIFDAISIEKSVAARSVQGGPAESSVFAQIEELSKTADLVNQ